MDTKLFVRHNPGGFFTMTDRAEFPSGTVFWVDSTNSAAADAAGGGQNPDTPLATLDYAIGLCTASKGDVVYLMPGHAETIVAATGAVLDKAGVSVIGLGSGALQPTFTLGTDAAATISVTAANCLIKNIRVTSNLANVLGGITTTTGADGLIVEDCVFTAPTADKELLEAIILAAGTDNVTIQRCQFYASSGNDSTAAVKTVGAVDRLRLLDNIAFGNFEAAVFDLDAAANTNITIARNLLGNNDATTGIVIANHATTDGIVSDNRAGGVKNNTETVVSAGTLNFLNYGTDTAGTTGILTPSTVTAWS